MLQGSTLDSGFSEFRVPPSSKLQGSTIDSGFLEFRVLSSWKLQGSTLKVFEASRLHIEES